GARIYGQKRPDLRPVSQFWLIPSPGYRAPLLKTLSLWLNRGTTSSGCCWPLDRTDYAGLIREEGSVASLSLTCRFGGQRKVYIGTTRGGWSRNITESVSTLRRGCGKSGCQSGIDVAGGGCQRRIARRRTAQICTGSREADRSSGSSLPSGSIVGNFRGNEGAHRSHSRSFVSRDASAQQVGNGDSRDDQDDRDHDQKFNQRETFLLFHGAPCELAAACKPLIPEASISLSSVFVADRLPRSQSFSTALS